MGGGGFKSSNPLNDITLQLTDSSVASHANVRKFSQAELTMKEIP